VIELLRRPLAAVRDRVDGLLHLRRRRIAAARLAELRPATVLFVCLGNVCRSPYAARVLASRTTQPLVARSGGYLGPGRSPPSEALQAARARGIEHSDHVSRILSPEEVGAADVIFVFDRFNVRDVRRSRSARPTPVLWLGDFDPLWTGKRAIIDPWGKPQAEFDSTFARIERCVDEVVRALDGSPTR
jgi:protein-tyrosine-phosphatase